MIWLYKSKIIIAIIQNKANKILVYKFQHLKTKNHYLEIKFNNHHYQKIKLFNNLNNL